MACDSPLSGIIGVFKEIIERLLLACAVVRRRFPVGESPTRPSLQPEATGATMEATKWLKPPVKRVAIW